MNLYNEKTRRRISRIIIIAVILAMLGTSLIAAIMV